MKTIRDHWEWMRGGKGWRRLLEHYPTEIAITNRIHPVTTLLQKDPGWVYVYSDRAAFILVRKIPSQEPFLSRFRQKELAPAEAPSLYFPG